MSAHSKTAGPSRGVRPRSLPQRRTLPHGRAGGRSAKENYEIAEREFYAAVNAAKRPSIVDDVRLLARSYADYAWASSLQGRHSEAEPLARWALARPRSSCSNPRRPSTQTLNQLATLYYEVGRFPEAESLLKRAIETQDKAPKPNLRELSRSQTLMGLQLIAERFAEAEAYFLQSIRLRERSLGASDPETGDSVNNLAWTYHEQGKDDQARPLFERALKIFEQSRGPTDPSAAHVLDGLAQIQARESEPEEAEAKYLRAIGIWDEQAPGGNVSLLQVLKHYSDLLEKLGRAATWPRSRLGSHRFGPVLPRSKPSPASGIAPRWSCRCSTWATFASEADRVSTRFPGLVPPGCPLFFEDFVTSPGRPSG